MGGLCLPMFCLIEVKMKEQEDNLRIPQHIAIILDGNGRWAKKRFLPRAMGHKAGCETLKKTVEDCARLGVRYLTVYGFSTENWKRSEEEVSALMQLFRHYMTELVGLAVENNIQVRMIGDKTRFDADIIAGIDNLVEKTKDNTGMVFVFAVNYGSRDEIRRAFIRMLENKELLPEEITEEYIAAHLDTAGIPDPDLLIRTSGEFRISNYLLWQIAYAEVYITDTLWPDFNKEELFKAIESYHQRERRFGGR